MNRRGVTSLLPKLVLMVAIIIVMAALLSGKIPPAFENLLKYMRDLFGLQSPEVPGPEEPQTDTTLLLAAGCSFFRCVNGCSSPEVSEIEAVGFPCNSFCSSDWTDNGKTDGKICGSDAEQFPVEVKIDDASKVLLSDIRGGIALCMNKNSDKNGFQSLVFKDSVIVDEIKLFPGCTFGGENYGEFTIKPRRYYISTFDELSIPKSTFVWDEPSYDIIQVGGSLPPKTFTTDDKNKRYRIVIADGDNIIADSIFILTDLQPSSLGDPSRSATIKFKCDGKEEDAVFTIIDDFKKLCYDKFNLKLTGIETQPIGGRSGGAIAKSVTFEFSHGSLDCNLINDYHGCEANRANGCRPLPPNPRDFMTCCNKDDIVNGRCKVIGCGLVVKPGSYILRDYVTTSGSCLVIGSDDVEIDCQGKKIVGNGGKIGIGVSGITLRKNIIVKNCNIEGFESGINLFADNSKIMNSDVSNSQRGITIFGSNNEVSNNKVVLGTTWGIYVEGSKNTIKGNTLQNNRLGITLSEEPTALASDNNLIRSNSISDSTYSGIKINKGSGNTIESNTISNGGSNGIWLLPNAPNNIIISNTVHDSIIDFRVESGQKTASGYNTCIAGKCSQTGAFNICVPNTAGDNLDCNNIKSSLRGGLVG